MKDASRLQVHVRSARLRAELSQAALAAAADLSRQSVNAIENGRLVPGTDVALRLAKALGATVEELFGLSSARGEVSVIPAADFQAGSRLVVAKVGEMVVAHPLQGERGSPEGFMGAQGYSTGIGSARLFATREEIEGQIIIAGCDPSLALFSEMVGRVGRRTNVTWLQASSEEALAMLRAGTIHIAGTHLEDTDGTALRMALAGREGVVVGYAAWEQGFVVTPGNPLAIRNASDLARPEVRLVNRNAGSGARNLLDSLLVTAEVSPTDIRGYENVVPGHLAVVRAVANGNADVGVALRAAASLFGLGFVPLKQSRFEFIVPSEHLAHPTVQEALAVLNGGAFREELNALPGYDTAQTGASQSVAAAA